ncbi:MAG: hypothetical protein ACI4OG_02165 [Bacilli bacterium]
MISKEYVLNIIRKVINNNKNISKDTNIQKIYDSFGFGYNEEYDTQLIMYLQQYNMQLETPYLASGQSGYFTEQIMKNGLGAFSLNEQDANDAKYISSCFGRKTNYSNVAIPITYTCVLGTVEFNYASQVFPAGIMEDVFQCSSNHELPIQPYVGELEEDFYLRLLENQINNSSTFDLSRKEQAIVCAKRLIHNFCKNKSNVYLIPINEVFDVKAYFGDVDGLRDGKSTTEEAQDVLKRLPSLKELLDSYYISADSYGVYNDPNMTSEYGISLYGNIKTNKLRYIEVESKYSMMQKRALAEGYEIGEVIPISFENDRKNSI